MATAAQVAARISATDMATPVLRGFIANLKGAQREAAGMGGALRGVAQQAAGFATAIGGMNLLGGAFGAVKGAVFDLNDQLQQSRVAFTTMLGGAQQADAFLRDMADFAAKTPFAFPDLVEASKRMFAMGFSAQQVRPLLTAVGNAAAAMGSGSEGVNRITLALGQMQAKTKVSAEEMNQLTEAGIPGWRLLAESMHLSVPEVQKLAEQGKVSADVFINAFQEFSRHNYGDMMAAQSKTFSGALSTISDSLRMAVAHAAAPFFNKIADGAVKLSEFVSGDKFAGWAQTVAGHVAALSDKFTAMLGGLKNVADWFMKLDPTVRTAAIAFAGMLGGVVALTAAIGPFLPILGGVAAALGALASPLGLVVVGVAALGAAFAANVGGIRDFATRLLPILQQELGALGYIASQVFDKVLVPAFNSAVAVLGRLGAAFGAQLPSAQGALEGVAGGLTAFNNFLVAAINTAIRFGAEVGKALSVPVGWVVQNWPLLTLAISGVMTAIGDVVRPVLAAMAAWWEQNGGLILAAVQAAWTAISGVIGAVVDTIGPRIQGFLLILNGDWKGGLNIIQGSNEEFGRKLGTIIGQWADTFKAWWSIVAPALAEFGKNLLAWAGDRVPEVVAKMREWAAAFADWVKEKAWPALQTKLGELATDLIGWVGDQVPAIFRGLGVWADKFAEWVDVALPQMLNKLSGLLDDLLAFVDDGSQKTDSRLGKWVEAFVAWARDRVWPVLEPALQKIGAALLTYLTDTAPHIWAKLGEWALLFGEWVITSALPKLLLALGKLLIRFDEWFATDAIPAIAKKSLELGGALASGVVGGLGDLAGALGTALLDQVTAALDSAKKALKIGSPSKVAADLIGKPIALGIAAGIADNADAGADALRRYLDFTRETRDYLNDWLTHIPEQGRAAALAMGKQLVGGGGSRVISGTPPPDLGFIPGGTIGIPSAALPKALPPTLNMGLPPIPGGAAPATTGGATNCTTITVSVTVNGFVGNDQDIARRLGPALREELVKIGLTNLKVGGRL